MDCFPEPLSCRPDSQSRQLDSKTGVLWRLLLGLFIALQPTQGFGHPSNTHVAAHQMEFFVANNRVEIHYLVQVPLTPETSIDELLAENTSPRLMNGFVLEVDGQHVPLELITSPEEPGEIRSQSIQITSGFIASLPSPPKEIRISNGNQPDMRGYFSTRGFLGPDLALTASNHALVANAGAEANLVGLWTIDEKSRTIELTVRPKDSIITRLHRFLIADRSPWKPISPSQPQTLLGTWSEGTLSPPISLLLLLFSSLTGLLFPTVPTTKQHLTLRRSCLPLLVLFCGAATSLFSLSLFGLLPNGENGAFIGSLALILMLFFSRPLTRTANLKSRAIGSIAPSLTMGIAFALASGVSRLGLVCLVCCAVSTIISRVLKWPPKFTAQSSAPRVIHQLQLSLVILFIVSLLLRSGLSPL